MSQSSLSYLYSIVLISLLIKLMSTSTKTQKLSSVSLLIAYCDVRMFLRATSAMMDVPTDEQELPEPVKLRVLCEVSDEWEKLGRIRHQRTT